MDTATLKFYDTVNALFHREPRYAISLAMEHEDELELDEMMSDTYVSDTDIVGGDTCRRIASAGFDELLDDNVITAVIRTKDGTDVLGYVQLQLARNIHIGDKNSISVVYRNLYLKFRLSIEDYKLLHQDLYANAVHIAAHCPRVTQVVFNLPFYYAEGSTDYYDWTYIAGNMDKYQIKYIMLGKELTDVPDMSNLHRPYELTGTHAPYLCDSTLHPTQNRVTWLFKTQRNSRVTCFSLCSEYDDVIETIIYADRSKDDPLVWTSMFDSLVDYSSIPGVINGMMDTLEASVYRAASVSITSLLHPARRAKDIVLLAARISPDKTFDTNLTEILINRGYNIVSNVVVYPIDKNYQCETKTNKFKRGC